jgi:DNA mismatch repair protein MutS
MRPLLLQKGMIAKRGERGAEMSCFTLGKEFLEGIEARESERTGITSLKISFNNVFGYYIEVRNTHKDKVPTEWIRKQTLVNAERYIRS